MAKTAITELLSPGRKRLNLDLVLAVVRALGVEESAVDVWRQACARVHTAAKSGEPTECSNNCLPTWPPSPAARTF